MNFIPATLHNSGSMDDGTVCDGCIEAIPILDPVDGEEAYTLIPLPHHNVQ
jgi:hypothetical protein